MRVHQYPIRNQIRTVIVIRTGLLPLSRALHAGAGVVCLIPRPDVIEPLLYGEHHHKSEKEEATLVQQWYRAADALHLHLTAPGGSSSCIVCA